MDSFSLSLCPHASPTNFWIPMPVPKLSTPFISEARPITALVYPRTVGPPMIDIVNQ